MSLNQSKQRKRDVKMKRQQTDDEDVDIITSDSKLLIDYEDEDKEHDLKPNLKGDYMSIFILLFLYILQGIPLGLAGSLPMMLQNRKVSYAQQAMFSFVNWPFSVKLIWAPIVDSLYFSRFGRRKSWLVPTQYLIGIAMIVISFYIETMLGDDQLLNKHNQSFQNKFEPTINQFNTSSSSSEESKEEFIHKPQMYLLTFCFLFLNFLCATQDIAVDGWALTMLSRRNVIYASTCNTVGQTAGYFLGNMLFLAFESPDFCNKYFRSIPESTGLVTLPGFIYFWGIVFIISTTLIMLFKSDAEHSSADSELDLKGTYKMLYKIFKLKSIRTYAFILLTCKIGFAITDSATGLKLIEAGVHKENIALIAIPMIPLQIILPWIISKYTKTTEPLDFFIKAYPYRLLFGIVFAMIVKWTYFAKLPDDTFSLFYYFVIIVAYSLHQVSVYSMFVAAMSFHAKISDPQIGGTYMTLLNTLANLGGNWPATLALWLVDYFTLKKCKISDLYCGNDETVCNLNVDDLCDKYLDGYYIETVLCIVIGFGWLYWGKSRLHNLQILPIKHWRLFTK